MYFSERTFADRECFRENCVDVFFMPLYRKEYNAVSGKFTERRFSNKYLTII